MYSMAALPYFLFSILERYKGFDLIFLLMWLPLTMLVEQQGQILSAVGGDVEQQRRTVAGSEVE